MNRIGPVRKPWKGRLARLRVLAREGPRKDEAKADDTLGRRSGRRVTATLIKRERGDRAKFRQGFCERALGGENPGEHPAVDALNMRPVARDSRED